MEYSAYDRAILAAAPGTFYDRKAGKGKSLAEALASPVEYPLGAALTMDQARAITDAGLRAHPGFVRVEDLRKSFGDKPSGWVYYYIEDPKHGLVREALKNKEASLQWKQAGRWKNATTSVPIVEDALLRLKRVFKRAGNDAMVAHVESWLTTREVGAEQGRKKKAEKEFLDDVKRTAAHMAWAAHPEVTYRVVTGLGSSNDKSLLAAERAGMESTLQRRYAPGHVLPPTSTIYSLERPPVWLFGHAKTNSILRTDANNARFGLSNQTVHVFERQTPFNWMFEFKLDDDGIVLDRYYAGHANHLRTMMQAIGVDRLRTNLDARAVEEFREDLASEGLRFDGSVLLIPPKPRANPRRARAR